MQNIACFPLEKLHDVEAFLTRGVPKANSKLFAFSAVPMPRAEAKGGVDINEENVVG